MLFGRAPLRVQPFFGFRGEDRISLTARALHSREPMFTSRNFLSDFRTMLGQYASREAPGVEVEFEYRSSCGEALTRTVTTDDEGFARFEFAFPSPLTRPKQTAWEQASLRWKAVAGEHDGGEVTAHILAPGTDASVGIISDVDDTIMETGITGNLRAIARNWKRVMVQMPSERILVPGAREFYASLGGNSALEHTDLQARKRPIFYVSSSPWNLFPYLVTFKRERDLPLGPIMLRDWGFNRRTLGAEGHGSHKLEAISRVLDHYPDMRFALIGDDTQKDAIAFAAIIAARREQVAAVFIRTVSWANPNEAQLAARTAIEKAGVPFWTGNDYRAVDAFLAEIGLDSDDEVEQLVRADDEQFGADN
ncbi:MAG: phosphatase domain-containing protein [Pseudomonadota bacterium]